MWTWPQNWPPAASLPSRGAWIEISGSRTTSTTNSPLPSLLARVALAVCLHAPLSDGCPAGAFSFAIPPHGALCPPRRASRFPPAAPHRHTAHPAAPRHPASRRPASSCVPPPRVILRPAAPRHPAAPPRVIPRPTAALSALSRGHRPAVPRLSLIHISSSVRRPRGSGAGPRAR